MTSFKGPLLLVGAMVLFALLDANSKLLAGRYGADQVLLIRYGTLLALLWLLRLLRPGAGGPISTKHPMLHLLRALCMALLGDLPCDGIAVEGTEHDAFFSLK
jgi:hypothetical protein